MKKLWLITALALAALSLFSGGTDTADINRMIFVSGIGIDRIGSDCSYTFYTAVPTGSDSAVSDNNVEYTPVTLTGGSMAEAVRALEMNSSRRVSFEHLNCCALGASALSEDIPALLDYLLRGSDVRRQCALLALDCSAEEFFAMDSTGSIASAAASMLELQDDSGSRRSIMSLGRLSSASAEDSGYCLYILGPAEKSSVSASDACAAGGIELRGLAVYGAGELTGRLTPPQAELARLFTDGQTSGIIAAVDTRGGRYLYEIRSSVCRTEFSPGIPPAGSFSIEIDCVPAESADSSGSFPSDEELEQSICSQLEQLLELSRTCGSAFTGLETEARRSSRLWYGMHRGNWEEIYRSALLEIDVMCRTADGSE